MAGELLQVQPEVNKLEDKRSTHRKGRKEVEYLVSFAGFGESQADWYPAKKVRK